MSKFKVGDKVILSNGDKWCVHSEENPKYRTVFELKGKGCKLTFGESENSERSHTSWFDNEIELYKEEIKVSKFKVGDKVCRADGEKWLLGNRKYKVVTKVWEQKGELRYYLSRGVNNDDLRGGVSWRDGELKLYKEAPTSEPIETPTELTYLETLNHLYKDGVEGEEWEVCNIDPKIGSPKSDRIVFENEGIRIKYHCPIIQTNILRDSNTRFRKCETKLYAITYMVEHAEGGKIYEFTRELEMEEPPRVGDLVVCDTKRGKSYGRVKGFRTSRMTNSEYNEYAKIIKKA